MSASATANAQRPSCDRGSTTDRALLVVGCVAPHRRRGAGSQRAFGTAAPRGRLNRGSPRQRPMNPASRQYEVARVECLPLRGLELSINANRAQRSDMARRPHLDSCVTADPRIADRCYRARSRRPNELAAAQQTPATPMRTPVATTASNATFCRVRDEKPALQDRAAVQADLRTAHLAGFTGYGVPSLWANPAISGSNTMSTSG